MSRLYCSWVVSEIPYAGAEIAQTSIADGVATPGSYKLLGATFNASTDDIRTSVRDLCDIAQICVAGLFANESTWVDS